MRKLFTTYWYQIQVYWIETTHWGWYIWYKNRRRYLAIMCSSFVCSFVCFFLCSFVCLFVGLLVCLSVCLFVRCLRVIQEFFTSCFHDLGLSQLGIEHPSFCMRGEFFNRMFNHCSCDPGNASKAWSDWS